MSDRQFQESKRIALQRQGWHCLRCGTNIHDPSLWPGRSGHHRQLRRRADPAVRDLPCNIVELCGSGTTGCHGCVLSSCYRPVWREFSFRKSGRF